MGVRIKYISALYPQNEVTNEQIAELMPSWTADKVLQKIGIEKRFVVDQNQTALDLAVGVCNQIKSVIDFDKIDGLVLCTQSPEYLLPTSSCILQDRIGLKNTTACFDFNLGCSGYIYGLAIVKGLISSGIMSNVLFVTSETYSKYIDEKDGSNRALFGDAATVTYLSKSDEESILNFSLGTDGSGYNNLIVQNGGTRNMNCNSKISLFMNGPEIFTFTESIIPNLVYDTLLKNHLTIEDVDYFIFHQANKFILDHLRKKMAIPENKFITNMRYSGNTVSNTIPIVLEKLILNKEYNNKIIMLIGFGVGYSWGGTIIKI
jgi:3-oxoacyl-[acyl-carrier-protein] synthase-3